MASSFSFLKTPFDLHSDFQVKSRQNQTVNDSQIDKPTALSVYLLERRIDCMSISSIVEAIHKACRENKKITVANYNIHSFNLSMQLPWYYEFLQSAEIANCDSVGILKAIGYMGLELPLDYRTSYTLLMPKVLESCDRQKYSVFLLGGKPQYLQTAIDNLQLKYPQGSFAGHHGYFDKQDPQANQSAIEKINHFKPNILIVGMGMPIQEHWVQQHRHNLQVNAIMLGGAIIDRMAGVVPDCPHVISDVGLEWFYRFCREPKRLAARYLLGNPAFALHIALAMFHKMSLRVELTPKLEALDL
jgi:N-acetylglucosaminyldiphosphoundecaprenol N-acetyl-beta-D-mannosaminyltransferase